MSIIDGPGARANDRGEWTLVNAPLGTRMLEIRALGYYPERRRVDVVVGAPAIHVALSTFKAVLDTIKVSASRLRYDRDSNGFNRRHRSGPGHYITPEDIARQAPIVTSDLFRMVPGVHLENDNEADQLIVMRGAFGACSPAIYLNDHYMSTLTAGDLDVWVRPKEIAGIEIYSEGTVPAEFQQGLSGCGSIVIWTK